jgi:hypothetical protein
VYASTHLISSKRQTGYLDFPIPSTYPEYASHKQILAYIQGFARHHDLFSQITFNTRVEQIERDGTDWTVALSDGTRRNYRGVVVANGHLWKPYLPQIPGHFSGRCIHSREYRSNVELQGQRVLVVGFGNSGCDIAIEAGRCAGTAFHSVRRGKHFVPKFMFGKPSDATSDWMWRIGVPLCVHRLLARWPLRAALIDPVSLGLPRPDHKLFTERVIPNEQYLVELAHGRFRIKPNIARFNDRMVEFTDGTTEEIDLVIFATGYELAFPFIDNSLLEWRDGIPWLFLNIFPPQHDTLFFVGLSEPSTRTWEVAQHVARLITVYLRAHESNNGNFDWFRQWKANEAGPVGSGRDPHMKFLEVEYHSYLYRLRRLFRRLGDDLLW